MGRRAGRRRGTGRRTTTIDACVCVCDGLDGRGGLTNVGAASFTGEGHGSCRGACTGSKGRCHKGKILGKAGKGPRTSGKQRAFHFLFPPFKIHCRPPLYRPAVISSPPSPPPAPCAPPSPGARRARRTASQRTTHRAGGTTSSPPRAHRRRRRPVSFGSVRKE